MSCGPAVAVMAGAMLDPSHGRPTDPSWFAAEQGLVHEASNRIWPRAFGTTPWGMSMVISRRSAGLGVRYGWRLVRRRDRLADVQRAVRAHRPVALLVGGVIPRHWVLIVDYDHDDAFSCYEPSSGGVVAVSSADIRGTRLQALGFPRAFAVVLPRRTKSWLRCRGR